MGPQSLSKSSEIYKAFINRFGLTQTLLLVCGRVRLEISLGARTLLFLYADLFINFILLMIMMEPFDDGTL